MGKVTIVVKGKNENKACGTASKEGITYEIRDLKASWKLVSRNIDVKIELVFKKKDFPTREEFFVALNNFGYTIE